ncbi:MAG: ABC transporter ATP-binding protein [Acidimicrobiia bacterium]|nr:ABC transporter ATP-binding protein [Acidimicrobiia bacterium]
MSGHRRGPRRRAIRRLADGQERRLALITALSVAGGIAEVGVLVLIVQAAVGIASDRQLALHIGPLELDRISVGWALVLALALTAGRLVVMLVNAAVTARLASDVQRRLRTAVFHAYIDTTWTVQAANREGGLQQLVGLEIERATRATLQLAAATTAACSLIILTVSAIAVSPLAALTLILAVGTLFLLLRPLTRRTRVSAAARSARELGMAESLDELVRTAEEVRVHGVARQRKDALAAEIAEIAGWGRRLNFMAISITGLYQAAALCVLIGALFVVRTFSSADVAASGAIVLVLLRAFAYSQQLQQLYHELSGCLSSIDAVDDAVARYRADVETPGRESLARIESIGFEAVSYSYDRGRPALSDITFSVVAGSCVGIVGPSGAGKSTLVQLILRLRDPQAGAYLVNGRPAAEYDVDEWARQVSYLPQEPKIVTGTVADNITFYREGFSPAQVQRAAVLANIVEDIAEWPAGYDTPIGHRVGAISGGQRQRLCLARALLAEPGLLVLDEPTSALDGRSERLVQDAIHRLHGQVTVVIVAHRLSTLSICDDILVLERGRLEAFGPADVVSSESAYFANALKLSRLP